VSARDRVSFEHAIAWIDGATRCLEAEEASFDAAAGRVLASDQRASGAIPSADCAAIDGFAVKAEASLGAGAYNPVAVTAVAVEAGEPMPPETDAVVPSNQAEPEGPGQIVLVEPTVAGANVDRRGAVITGGMLLAAAGTRLTPGHLGLLALAGGNRISVTRRPRVRLAITGKARSGPPVDSNGPMLRALIERDGGALLDATLADAFAGDADIIIIAGGTGRGPNDRSVEALAAAGSLDIHGVALMPGETAGLGHTLGGVPVLLLPGSPAACLWNYELFAGRAIRRLGGRNSEPPYRVVGVTTTRKIVSAIGLTEICPIRRLADGRVEPLAAFAGVGLMATAAADGFMIVPAASEGYPAGATINAYFYGEC
jgi:molybdopterin molybdotransferase